MDVNVKRIPGSSRSLVTVDGPEKERMVYSALPRFTSKARLRHMFKILVDGMMQDHYPESQQQLLTYPIEFKISRRDLGRLATRSVISPLKYEQAILGITPHNPLEDPGPKLVSSTIRPIDQSTRSEEPDLEELLQDLDSKQLPDIERPVDYEVDFPEYNE